MWLASKLEETPRRIRDILFVFDRINQRREGLPIEPLEQFSKVRDSVHIGTWLLLLCTHILDPTVVPLPGKRAYSYGYLLVCSKFILKGTGEAADGRHALWRIIPCGSCS